MSLKTGGNRSKPGGGNTAGGGAASGAGGSGGGRQNLGRSVIISKFIVKINFTKGICDLYSVNTYNHFRRF